jgi:hypothetical protein
MEARYLVASSDSGRAVGNSEIAPAAIFVQAQLLVTTPCTICEVPTLVWLLHCGVAQRLQKGLEVSGDRVDHVGRDAIAVVVVVSERLANGAGTLLSGFRYIESAEWSDDGL